MNNIKELKAELKEMQLEIAELYINLDKCDKEHRKEQMEIIKKKILEKERKYFILKVRQNERSNKNKSK